MNYIQKIKLFNFKRFKETTILFTKNKNILIGDNESGKSSILIAIELVLSGSRNKAEKIGLDKLFNIDTINEFLTSKRNVNKLPIMFLELYLNEQNNEDLNGKNNSDDILCDGLRFICEPIIDLDREINEILKTEKACFPFEYYSIKFKTFSDMPYTGYKKFINYISIDSSQINNEYATREYIKTIYNSMVVGTEKNKNLYEYRNYKDKFKTDILTILNNRLDNYYFTIINDSKSNLETDITIAEDGITIDNKGKGKQSFIKTEFALHKNKKKEIDVLLLEEPENHLSHINMKKLIGSINSTKFIQIFIATHSSLISTRLNLRKSILLNSNSFIPLLLNEVSKETAKYFMKSPDNNILEYILSKNIILVEGHSEYILMEQFFENITGIHLEESEIHVISVGGTSFKRYLEIGKILKIKTAVIRDNDKKYEKNCIDLYADYICDFIKVFADNNNNMYTFEVCLYRDNKDICDHLFSKGLKKLTVLDYMLKNKAEVAFELLDKKGDLLNVPQYIKDAIEWIRS